jgi:two-component system, OmpR family, sensor histidine kinase CpxA
MLGRLRPSPQRANAMPRLFWKIFVWFWVSMLVVDCAVIFSIISTQSTSDRLRWQQFTHSMMSLQARQAAEVFEKQGSKELVAYLSRLQVSSEMQLALYGPDGSDVLGAPASDSTKALVSNALRDKETQFSSQPGDSVMVAATTGPSGVRYVLTTSAPSPPFLGFMRGGIRAQAFRILAVGLAVTLVCLVLAHYIASPILHLQNVSRHITVGDLGARVQFGKSRRRDEIADLGRDFNIMADRIESLLHSQNQLLKDISHEIRSPLSRLTLAVGLAKTSRGGESDDLLERAEREAERIEDMLAQLLTVARLDGGAASFPKTPVELSLLLSEIVDDASFEGSATKRSVLLAKADACFVDGSESLLRSAIENVVRNAVRYTRPCSIVEVNLNLEKLGGKEFAVIQVLDEGPGVPSGELTHIFKPFYRVDDARQRETGGVGLGLTITERAISFYQGTVSARNRDGGGLEVQIRLPLFPSELKEEKRSWQMVKTV